MSYEPDTSGSTKRAYVTRYEYDFIGGGHFPHHDGEWVTHADYKAMEDEKNAWMRAFADESNKYVQLEKELSGLRVKVMELASYADVVRRACEWIDLPCSNEKLSPLCELRTKLEAFK